MHVNYCGLKGELSKTWFEEFNEADKLKTSLTKYLIKFINDFAENNPARKDLFEAEKGRSVKSERIYIINYKIFCRLWDTDISGRRNPY